jgi:hypothetical protein
MTTMATAAAAANANDPNMVHGQLLLPTTYHHQLPSAACWRLQLRKRQRRLLLPTRTMATAAAAAAASAN